MTHLHPKDTGGAILSLDYMHPAARWEWGGPDWQQHVDTSTSLIITAAELQADDPADMARRWARALGLVAEQHHQTYHIALQQSEIRFVSPADTNEDCKYSTALWMKPMLDCTG